MDTKNTKAKIAANKKYDQKAYDHVGVILPKGKKEIIQQHLAKTGESMSAYINRAINEQLKREDAKQ